MVLARTLEASPYESGSGIAALSKELSRLMQTIAARRIAPDLLDELRVRRERKRAVHREHR